MNRLFTKRCERTSLNRCADKSALKCFRKQIGILLIIMVIGFAVFNSKSAAAEEGALLFNRLQRIFLIMKRLIFLMCFIFPTRRFGMIAHSPI